MNNLIRTFICIELPKELKEQLQKMVAGLTAKRSGNIGWVKAHNLHLTLRFLGDLPQERIADVTAAVTKAAQDCPAFSLTTSGTGVFPNPRNPRVFWVGVKHSTEYLLPLEKRLETELMARGFGKSDKPFSPHLTIGRVKPGDNQEITANFLQTNLPESAFFVSEIIVMRSELDRAGAIYSKLAVIKLG